MVAPERAAIDLHQTQHWSFALEANRTRLAAGVHDNIEPEVVVV